MNTIPKLGFGVWQVEDKQAIDAVKTAIQTGYRSIDTAAIYNNEEGVGKAIKESGVNRSELYITTKLWNSDQGAATTQKAFETSLKKLNLDYVDLYLIHWPAPSKNLYAETWKEMIKIKESGRAKQIGVSNFHIPHLERIINETGVVPYVNQIELHPTFQQRALKEFHKKHSILTEAWSPLGQGHDLNNQMLSDMAKKYSRSVAQVILRWHLDSGHVVIPKSVTPSRIKENFNVQDFKLSDDDLHLIATLDSSDGRIGPNPETANF